MEDRLDITVETRLSLLIKERFGPDSEFFADEILSSLLVRHDLPHLLEQSDIAVKLRNASNASPGAQKVSDKLSQLHREYGCLWILHRIALSEEPIQLGSSFAAIASLDLPDAARLNDLVQLYDQVCQHLVVFLKPIGIQEDLIIWNDKQLKTGEAWHKTIPSKLKSAKAVILLISPEFLGSDYIRETELPIILQRHADEQLKIFPLLLRPSVFQRAKYKYPHPKNGPNEILLSSIMTVNPPSQALNEIDEGKQDRFFVKLADDLLEQLGKHP